MAICYINVANTKHARACFDYITGRSSDNSRVIASDQKLPSNLQRTPDELLHDIRTMKKNDNEREAKLMILALPHELKIKQQKELIEAFIKANITNKKYGCVYAIHKETKKGNKNIHAHIMIYDRPIEKGKFANLKRKCEYTLDKQGNRIPVLDHLGNQKLDSHNRKQWKRHDVIVNEIDTKEWLKNCKSWLEKELLKNKQIKDMEFKSFDYDTKVMLNEKGEKVVLSELGIEPTKHEGHHKDKIKIHKENETKKRRKSSIIAQIKEKGVIGYLKGVLSRKTPKKAQKQQKTYLDKELEEAQKIVDKQKYQKNNKNKDIER